MRKLLVAALILSLGPTAAMAEDGHEHHAAEESAPEIAEESAPVVAPAPQAAAVAAPQGPSAVLSAAPEKKASKPFRMGVSIDNSMNSGTLTGKPYNSYVASSLVLGPSYAFELAGVKLSASGNLSSTLEYTSPDNSLGRHFTWRDVSVGLAAPSLYKDKLTGISVSPNVGLTLPTSRESWWRGSITSLSAGLGLNRAFGKFSLGGRLGASHTVNSEVTQTLSERQRSRRDDQENLLFICRTDQVSCGLRGIPALWALSGGVNAGYSPFDKLSLSVGFNLSKRWAYETGLDEYSSTRLDIDGNRVVKAQGQADIMAGLLRAGYKLTDSLSASLAMSTSRPPKHADNSGFRFPFFAFEGIEASYTNFSLGVSSTF